MKIKQILIDWGKQEKSVTSKFQIQEIYPSCESKIMASVHKQNMINMQLGELHCQ